jgi:hypothetical protein
MTDPSRYAAALAASAGGTAAGAAGSPFAVGSSLAGMPSLNIRVPQVTQVPFIAGLPFRVRVSVAFDISFIALHLKQ